MALPRRASLWTAFATLISHRWWEVSVLLGSASRPLEPASLVIDLDHRGRQLASQRPRWLAESTFEKQAVVSGDAPPPSPPVALMEIVNSEPLTGALGDKMSPAPATAVGEAATPKPKSHHAPGKPGRGKKGAPEGGHHCSCLEASELPLPHDVEGNVLLPASFFGLAGDQVFKRSWDYGTYCGAHDDKQAPLCDEHKKGQKLKPSCRKNWCFVSVNCACGEAAKSANGKMQLKDAWHIPMSQIKTDYANPQEGQETNVWFSYMNCRESKAWIDEHMATHNETFCGSHSSARSVHCEQESEVCYRDGQGGRYAGSQAKAGSTNAHWISVALGLGAFLLLVLIGWALEGLRSSSSVT